MTNIDGGLVEGPNTKIIGIFVCMAALVVLITFNMNGVAFADPLHCDRSGWPSCYSVGFSVGKADGNQAVNQDLPFDDSCPGGHSNNYCAGYKQAYDSAYNINGKSSTFPQPTLSAYDQGYQAGFNDAGKGIYNNPGCGTGQHSTFYCDGWINSSAPVR